ncbi:MAG: hypothetical protein GKR96_08510 [Gammaproteobacteria bacterium]|nr:hypothetical protein [Gammaproteobacteria bacterium]
MSEKISALVDEVLLDEDRENQFGQILSDEQATQTWQRYHLIGNVIRNEVQSTGKDLSADIWSKIEEEPTVLAPSPKKRKDSKSADIWSAAGLFAVAASVTLVAVIGLGPLQKDDQAGQVALNQFVDNEVLNSSLDQQRITDEFGEMLAEHGEFSSSAGLNGLVAYAKLVSNQAMDQ